MLPGLVTETSPLSLLPILFQSGVVGVPKLATSVDDPLLQSVHHTNRPAAGLVMASRSAWVIRGINAPLVVDWISRIALAAGSVLSVLMATCARSVRLVVANKVTISIANFLFIMIQLLLCELSFYNHPSCCNDFHNSRQQDQNQYKFLWVTTCDEHPNKFGIWRLAYSVMNPMQTYTVYCL